MTTQHHASARTRWPFGRNSSKFVMCMILSSIVIFLLATKGIRNEGTASLQGDMPRYLMNGAYFYDVIRELPLAHPLQYTYHYFARYPALSLGHHPMLLSVAEVPFYAIFGISVFSGRVTILGFMLLAGMAWFLLIKSLYTESIAFLSTLLFITTPFIVNFSRVVMSEVPALALIIVATYLLYHYCQFNKTRYLSAFIVVLLLSILARYQAILMVPIFLGDVLIIKRPQKFITKKSLLVCVFMLLLLLPVIFLAMNYSPTNIRWLTRQSLSSRITLSNILYHITAIWKFHLTLPVVVLSVFSACVSVYRRDKRALLFLIWIVGYYLQITCIGATVSPRYSLYWIPAFCLLAAITVELFQYRLWKVLCSSILITIAGYQFAIAFQSEPEYAAGYEQAAKYVLERQKGKSVLYSANVDTGYFIFFVRKYDPHQDLIVLRADKTLVTSHLRWIVEERINNREQIYENLQDFGVGYVVIEDQEFESPPLAWLREEVKTDKFILRKRIPLRSNSKKLKGVALEIYEYMDHTPPKPGKMLRINIPLIDNFININFDDLL